MERKWLKALLDSWSIDLTVRLSLKTVKPKDVDYGFGSAGSASGRPAQAAIR